jgi:hypothetical protein
MTLRVRDGSGALPIFHREAGMYSPTRSFYVGARPNKNKILVYIASNNLPGNGRMTPLSSIFKSKLESLKVGN